GGGRGGWLGGWVNGVGRRDGRECRGGRGRRIRGPDRCRQRGDAGVDVVGRISAGSLRVFHRQLLRRRDGHIVELSAMPIDLIWVVARAGWLRVIRMGHIIEPPGGPVELEWIVTRRSGLSVLRLDGGHVLLAEGGCRDQAERALGDEQIFHGGASGEIGRKFCAATI